MDNSLRVLIAMLAVQVLVSMSSLAVPVAAPLAARDFGVEPYLVGIFVSIVYAFAAISGLLSGGFIARFGALRVSQSCTLFAGLGLAVLTLATVPAGMVAALFIGLAYGPATAASSHVLARSTPKSRLNLIFSIKQTGVPLGNALAGAIVPPTALAIGWRPTLLCVALACVVVMLAVQPLRRGLDADRNPRRRLGGLAGIVGPLRLALGPPDLRRLTLASFCYAGAQTVLGTFLVVYLHEARGLPLVFAGLALSAGQGAGVVGRILWGIIADRLASPTAVLAGLGLGMAAFGALLALLGAGWPGWLIVLVCIGYGGTAVAWNGVHLAQIARLSPPGRTAEVTGGSFFVTFGGVMATPLGFSLILATTGSYPAGFAAMAVLTLLCGLSFVRQVWRE